MKKSILLSGCIILLSAAMATAQNYFAGTGSGTANTGSGCTGVGFQSIYSGNSGSFNTAVGFQSLFSNSSGADNTAIGSNSLRYNGAGFSNTALGSYSLYLNSSGSLNTAIGFSSQNSNTSGKANTSVGSSSLLSNSTGSSNTALGNSSMEFNSTGKNNTAVGDSSMRSNSSGADNVAVGKRTLVSNQIGEGNTAVGTNAGSLRNKYSRCTFIGNGSDGTRSNLINATAIGNNAKVNAHNKVQVGNINVTSIGGQVSWTTASDFRLKENIRASKLGLDFILQLRPVTYNYKEGQDGILYTGLIAQEVDQAARKLGVEFSGVDKNADYWGIRYGDLTVPLISAVQELKKENDQLKEALNQLQKQVYALMGTSGRASESYNSIRLNVAPNPASSSVRISVESNLSNSLLTVNVLDVNNRLITSFALNGSDSFELNTSAYSKGVYFIQLSSENGTLQTEKLIIR
ncbi:MAG: tail fiber domain-containing protein [Bacteroidia bacterium]|nr:tail fiber domain-containing protein [Bacteroidia bacterium]MCZ2278310.1 tail fiber domain-containing protein [Bacteroidia bacterium]